MTKNDTYKNADDELRKISPELWKLKKQNPFTVPEDYFESQYNEIKAKVSAEKDGKWGFEIRGIFLRPLNWISIAAAALVITVIIIYSSEQKNTETNGFSEITFELILEESPEIIEYMEDDIFYEAFFSNSGAGVYLLDSLGTVSDPEITEDEIIKYLIEEDYLEGSFYNL